MQGTKTGSDIQEHWQHIHHPSIDLHIVSSFYHRRIKKRIRYNQHFFIFFLDMRQCR